MVAGEGIICMTGYSKFFFMLLLYVGKARGSSFEYYGSLPGCRPLSGEAITYLNIYMSLQK